MRALLLHCKSFEYEAIEKETENAEEVKEKSKKYENVLVAFVAVEEGDNKDVAIQLAREIVEDLKEVRASALLIYPYSHLSEKLASSAIALDLLKEMERFAREQKVVAFRAPFGWTKKFKLELFGHALAERFKHLTSKELELVSKALKAEERIRSNWYILTPRGELHPIELKGDKIVGFDFTNYENLEKFARYEMKKVRAVEQEPPHVKLMRKLEIADYEPGSDPGNMRWYPKGRLIKNLLERWITEKAIAYGAMEVETPVMYDYEHPALKDYLHRFPARQYTVQSAKRKLFLRFSACFGQFLMKSHMTISYKHLPLRMYELTRYSFRLEKRGELVGLRRLRAFTMPDMHTLCKDLEQAKSEFARQFEFCMQCLADLGFSNEDYETAIRFTKSFWEKNKDFIIDLVKRFGRPVLIEMWERRYAYFDPKFEFNFIDALNKASALSTVQIDHENAKRYGITYVDEDGKEKYPLILHCSPSGALERCIYAILEREYMRNPERATFPLWLAPTQVRICPVSEEYVDFAVELANELKKNRIRVDVDDRNETVEKKIRESELEWTPLTVVVGKKEKESGKLPVRIRREGRIVEMSLEELISYVKERTKGFPFLELSLPMLLSKRPKFVG